MWLRMCAEESAEGEEEDDEEDDEEGDEEFEEDEGMGLLECEALVDDELAGMFWGCGTKETVDGGAYEIDEGGQRGVGGGLWLRGGGGRERDRYGGGGEGEPGRTAGVCFGFGTGECGG